MTETIQSHAQRMKDNLKGRPGALTVTAIGMKSKAKPAIAGINSKAVEKTNAMIEEKYKNVKPTGIPEAERERMRQWKTNLARKGK